MLPSGHPKVKTFFNFFEPESKPREGSMLGRNTLWEHNHDKDKAGVFIFYELCSIKKELIVIYLIFRHENPALWRVS